jgi:WD40 repeat protein
MQLSSSSFLATPSLPTERLEGAEECNGQLLFSDDEKWLVAWGDSGHLQIWNLPTRQRVLFYNESTVRGVLVAEHLGGILVAAADGLLLFKSTDAGFVHHTVATHLPGLSEHFFPDSEDAAVVLCASRQQLVCCTRQHIVALDPHTYQVVSFLPLITDAHRRLHHLSAHLHQGTVLIWSISSVRHGGTMSYRYAATSPTGANVFEMSIEIPEFRLLSLPCNRCRPGVASGLGELSVVISHSPPSGVDALALLPYKDGMQYTASDSGSIIAGRVATSFAVWDRGRLIGEWGIEKSPYDLKLTDDGKLAMILFCDGLKTHDVTGVVDLTTGKQLGYCTGHIIGLTPVAFSKSNRYFATLITDGTASYHPAGLPSGTVVLTELPVGDRA